MDEMAPLLLKDRDIAALLNISRATFWTMIRDGRFGPLPVKMGRCKRWKRSDVELWCEWGLPDRAVFVSKSDDFTSTLTSTKGWTFADHS